MGIRPHLYTIIGVDNLQVDGNRNITYAVSCVPMEYTGEAEA